MERRTIITIVLLAVAGLGFLFWYNVRKDAKPEEPSVQAEVVQPWRPATTQWDITAGTAFAEGFTATVSSAGAGLSSVALHDPQYIQHDKTGSLPAEYGIPKSRMEEGPHEVVGTWEPFLSEPEDRDGDGQVDEIVRYLNYPFHFEPTKLGWHGGGNMTRLVRPESTVTADAQDPLQLTFDRAPADDDLEFAIGDKLIAQGVEPVTVTRVLDERRVIISAPLPTPLPKVRVDRVGPPLEQYKKDGRFVAVESPEEGVQRFVWPNPARDESDLYVQRDWWVKDVYVLGTRTQVINLSSRNLTVAFGNPVIGWVDPNAESPGMFSAHVKHWTPSCYVDDSFEEKGQKSLLVDGGWGCGFGRKVRIPSQVAFDGRVNWYGLNSQYFLLAGLFPQEDGRPGICTLAAFRWSETHAIKGARYQPNGVIEASYEASEEVLPGAEVTCLPDWYPRGKRTPDIRCSEAAKTLNVAGKSLDEARLEGALELFVGAGGDRDEAIRLKTMLLAHGEAKDKGSLEFTVFAGPKDLEVLAKVDPNSTLDKSLDFWFVGMIAKPMLYLLKLFHSWVFSWALAIVLLTVMIKLLLLPVTQKMYTNMQKMQQLRPEMETIQKKYGDSMEAKQKSQREVMDLYKRHNVNPLGGCLPMLLQFPVYIALYRTIYSAVDLYQQPLFGWIDDMTQADPYFILPIALGGFMVLQQAFMPSSPGMDPMQQKIMKIGMPIFFSMIMLFLPSGLVFYIFVNTVISLGQQWLIKRRFDANPLPAVGGKGGRRKRS